jgi:phosphoglycolate phosphatase/pyrophosphatase PpaX
MYHCLLVDHDDTCVDSTRHIHYPAHCEIIRRMRPDLAPESLDVWFEKNFHPGVFNYYTGELNFSPEEMKEEFAIWRSFTTTRIPSFFPGMVDTLKSFRAAGGMVVVVSHSEEEHILRDYSHGAEGFIPDLVFGWHDDPERRKPHPWPALKALERLGIDPRDAAMLDDLSPGIEMAGQLGIDTLGAGWGHHVPSIREEMKRRCRKYFSSVGEFRSFLLEN